MGRFVYSGVKEWELLETGYQSGRLFLDIAVPAFLES